MEEPVTISLVLSGRSQERTVGQVDSEQLHLSPPPSLDPVQDERLISTIQGHGRSADAQVDYNVRSTQGFARELNYGGMASLVEVAETLTVAWPYLAGGAVGAAGLATFLNNALGAIEKWKSLRGGRSVTVTYKDRSMSVSDGDTVQDILEKAERLVRGQD